MKCQWFHLFILYPLFSALSASEGTLMNPFTDVCWECLFPITVSSVNVTPSYQDQAEYSKYVCFCSGKPPKAGIPLSFWEPTRLVDVTRHAYKLIGLGGVSIGNETIKNRGTIGITGDGPSQYSFYHVHWYTYPIFSLLGLFADFTCVEKADLDLAYLSELDPTWYDDQLSLIMNAESALFSNPLAQLTCLTDCTASSANKPLDKLFWCAGCEGSLYPFTGSVAHHVGTAQASYLLVHRVIAKLHRTGFMKGFDEKEFCEASYMPIIKKSLYKTQLIYPIPQTKGSCHALGKSDVLWGTGKAFPVKGEDFVYLLWIKKQCCLDAVKPAATVGGVTW
ncbi:Type IV conjugative transfer system protein TraU (plasmid) [Candidatus Protochlamydia naegleriophila]|uniref:Type IV conjugative transfer system protein TraU n=1 Tax=Candidatus Protochlamydia naegleriophila TaxID=389348 RepID=A0A0U5JDZ6_9BACT|nr:TraU family protein [Candidatus Protochlamydia naegleriophila]CUI18201.1 Type IV conjugative transfer system protein TraU [Candidatus Protochlamydia naegleriophila]